MRTLQLDAPARLHHLHITSDDPGRLAGFYREFFLMGQESLSEDSFMLTGGSRSVLISQGAPATLACAGYAVTDESALEAIGAHLVRRGMLLEDGESPFFLSGAIRLADPQGRRIEFGVPRLRPCADALPARLQHTVFQTTELESSVRFYVDILGFMISDEVVDDDGKPAVVFLRSDDEHHSLAFFRGSRNEWDHHCYETTSWTDIRDWGDRSAAARIPIFFGPGRHGPGNNLFFMVTDPDGNRLEFSAEIQRVPADTAPGVWPHDERTLNAWGRAWMRS